LHIHPVIILDELNSQLPLQPHCTLPSLYLPPSHFFFFYRSAHHPNLHSFPTRRSSDLWNLVHRLPAIHSGSSVDEPPAVGVETSDRKSTRLNSSHVAISYAVFCLKKKKRIKKSARCHDSVQMMVCGLKSTSAMTCSYKA